MHPAHLQLGWPKGCMSATVTLLGRSLLDPTTLSWGQEGGRSLPRTDSLRQVWKTEGRTCRAEEKGQLWVLLGLLGCQVQVFRGQSQPHG